MMNVHFQPLCVTLFTGKLKCFGMCPWTLLISIPVGPMVFPVTSQLGKMDAIPLTKVLTVYGIISLKVISNGNNIM